MKIKLLIIVSLAFSTATFSQSVKTLEYNVGLGAFIGLLPFDQPFNLKLINIPKKAGKQPDNIVVRLLEVPKKDYSKISKYKKKKGLNWKIVTPDDVYASNNGKDSTYIFTLGTLKKDEKLVDTFYNIAVPFYLKPESKYLIDVRYLVTTTLTEADKDTLEKFIKNNRLFQKTINSLIRENITDFDVNASKWAASADELRNIAEQAVKSKQSNYVLNDIDYGRQLRNLSKFLIDLTSISSSIDKIEQLAKLVPNDDSVRKNYLSTLTQKGSKLTSTLKAINWVVIKYDDSIYNSLKDDINDLTAFNSIVLADAVKDQLTRINGNMLKRLDKAIDEKEDFIEVFVSKIANDVVAQSTIASTNSESMVEQAKLHVTFDLGYAYVGQIDRGNAYAGINIYFRSIDTSLPLKNYRLGLWDFIGSRTSLLIGMSVQSIQKDSVRKGLIGNNALVTGIGFRLLPWFKINGGAYMYYLYSRNPLRSKNDYSFKASPFISLSIDFNLSTFFETFGNGNITNIFKK